MTLPVTFLSFLLPVVAGTLWVPSFLPGGNGTVADRGFRISLGAGVGLGAGSLAYFFLRSASAGVSAARLFLFEAVLFSSLAYLAMRYAKEKSLEASPEPDAKAITVPRWVPGTLAALFFFLVAGVILTEVFLTFDRPHGGWDAWAIWNLRARFLFRGGEYWRDAFSPLLSEIHPDYPLLLPGLVARGWTYLGRDAVSFPAAVAVFYTLSTIGMLASSIAILRGSSQGILAGVVLACTPIFLAAWSLPICRRAVRVLHAGDVLPAASVEVPREPESGVARGLHRGARVLDEERGRDPPRRARGGLVRLRAGFFRPGGRDPPCGVVRSRGAAAPARPCVPEVRPGAAGRHDDRIRGCRGIETGRGAGPVPGSGRRR